MPTLVLGYERKLSSKTHLILQGYVSPSVFSREETDLDELLATKYQLSRIGRGLLSFAVTEILQNVDNTPDIGGWAYSSARCRREVESANELVSLPQSARERHR